VTGLSDRSEIPNNSPLSRREVSRQIVDAYLREAKSPRYVLSGRLFLAGVTVALAYMVTLAVLGEVARTAWVTFLDPITRITGMVIPSVRWVGENLVVRGFPERAAYVSNVIAAQWLINAAFFLVAAALVIPERANIRRGFAAASAVRARSRPNPVPQGLAILFGMFCWMYSLLHSVTQDTAPGAFDLAVDSKGLFVPFLLMTTAGWGLAYYAWLHLLASITIEKTRRTIFGRPRAEYIALAVVAPLAAVVVYLFVSTLPARH
jgi:hypothetical protein